VRQLAFGALAALALMVAPTSAGAASGIVRAQATLPPGPYLFGEQITADVDVLVNTKLVDPQTVRVETRFFPYRPLAAPRRTETVDGSVADVRFRYVLACVSLECLTGSKLERKVQFTPTRIRYRDRRQHVWRRTVNWREISRVGNDQIRPATASQARFALPSEPLLQLPASVVAPSPSYRLSPLLLALVLAGLAAGVLVATFFVARPVLALARRGRGSAAPELSPLEQAIAAVEEAARRQTGGAEHREALALLARELRRAHLLDLVHSTRKLAWSEQAPSAAASRGLLAEVREAARSVS